MAKLTLPTGSAGELRWQAVRKHYRLDQEIKVPPRNEIVCVSPGVLRFIECRCRELFEKFFFGHDPSLETQVREYFRDRVPADLLEGFLLKCKQGWNERY